MTETGGICIIKHMRKFLIGVTSLFIFIMAALPVFAQTTPLPDQPLPVDESFAKGKVLKILNESVTNIAGYKTYDQTLQVQVLEGSDKGKIVTLDKQADFRLADAMKSHVGETVILDIMKRPGEATQYTITDSYRLDKLLYIFIAFFILILLAAGKKGVGAVLGLLVSLAVILWFVVPQMLHGSDPLTISVIGCFIILLLTTFLAHGFSKQTAIAVTSTCIALLATVLFSYLAVQLAHLAGLGTEDSYILELNPTQSINPKGLLLGGILIGTLGALNDITTTQVAAIFALFKSNSKLSALELAEHGLFIGREHIVSLVNTLVLAYAGSSLPIFIFFILNPSHLPVWVIVNNESVSEEIVRTVAGSMGLILAIPITTLLATWYVSSTLKKN